MYSASLHISRAGPPQAYARVFTAGAGGERLLKIATAPPRSYGHRFRRLLK
jgi:hypothetical protein